jgi:hypothetical protein
MAAGYTAAGRGAIPATGSPRRRGRKWPPVKPGVFETPDPAETGRTAAAWTNWVGGEIGPYHRAEIYAQERVHLETSTPSGWVGRTPCEARIGP